MKKIINKPEDYTEEFVRGIIKAHSDQYKLLNDDYRMLIRSNSKDEPKVGIVTAGGSGHLPLFLGYVGENMLDGCAVGNVFASPSSSKMEELIRHCDSGKGVLCLYGNYGGDNLNFEMATEMVEFDDIETIQIRVKDDIASASEDKKDTRRGVAGIVYAYKIAGAEAGRGYDLEKVAEITNRALDNIRTMGVALSATIVPEVGEATFNISEDEIEIGMGIHGESGIEVRKMISADEIAEILVEKILTEIELSENDEVSVLINGLGATPLDEQYIVYNKVYDILDEKKVKIIQPHIGNFATSMEMSGLSITIFKLDSELKELLLEVASTPFYTNYNR